LQLALMALDLPNGSEVITAGFSYAAVAEVCLLLGLKPVFADVDINTFNINPLEIEKQISPLTKAIVPVHLFGQSCDMEVITAIAEKHNLYVIEDNAQSFGADFIFSDGRIMKSGSIGHISTTSFFPSKNLGCYGDGGAVFTNNDELAKKIKMLANHGQEKKYHHEVIGINSRLDAIQAAVLKVKLTVLEGFIEERQKVATKYDLAFAGIDSIRIPYKDKKSTHVYHQYTLQLYDLNITEIQEKLKEKGIPSMVYYPMPLYKQNAYRSELHLPVTEALCDSVLSLPIGTDMTDEQIEFITNQFKEIIYHK
jgi:UDP-2-acetamido-2-deoxy-ribo-hexuluronate aminotransferase